MNQYAEGAKIIGAVVIMLTIISLALGPLLGVAGTPVVDSVLLENNRGSLAPPADENITVEQSLGTKLEFDGSPNAALDAQTNAEFAGDMEVCTWVTVANASTGSNMTVVALDDAKIQYLGNASSPQWVGVLWDPGERVTYDANVSATSPTTPTHVCVRESGTYLEINANGTDGDAVPMDGAHTLTHAQYNISTLNGSVEETRGYNESLSVSERTALRNEPTAPLDTATPRVRVMYDSRATLGSSPSSFPVYFAGTDASVTGGTLVAGYDGQTTSAGDDYRLTDFGGTLIAVNGGTLDGAPVAFVEYEGSDGPFAVVLSTLGTTFASVIGLLAVGLLVVAATRVMDGMGGGF